MFSLKDIKKYIIETSITSFSTPLHTRINPKLKIKLNKDKVFRF
jgi:hypothetical protein